MPDRRPIPNLARALLVILIPLAASGEVQRRLVLTTGYCPCRRCCGRHADGRTATGRRCADHPWGIAADPAVVPYGTRVIVPGYKPSVRHPDDHPWEVDDTGVAVRAAAARGVLHLDLRFIHHASARRWGRRWVEVLIVTPPAGPRLAAAAAPGGR